MKSIISTIGISVCLILSGCTEPGETTGIGAATGGVLGAGLGAIVGNQTGDPGAGLAIGALAGASAGAAVGNALQAQQEAIRTQDEALERQENMIRAQNRELDEYRRSYGQDSAGAGRAQGRSSVTTEAPAYEPSSRAAFNGGSAGTVGDRPLRSRDITSTGENPGDAGKPDIGRSAAASAATASTGTVLALAPRAQETSATGRISPAKPLTPECQNAQDEIGRAAQSGEVPERLFHYRRALRLCPDNASFHNGLGELYLGMNRKSDAEFEFREALRLDPALSAARENLSLLQR